MREFSRGFANHLPSFGSSAALHAVSMVLCYGDNTDVPSKLVVEKRADEKVWSLDFDFSLQELRARAETEDGVGIIARYILSRTEGYPQDKFKIDDDPQVRFSKLFIARDILKFLLAMSEPKSVQTRCAWEDLYQRARQEKEVIVENFFDYVRKIDQWLVEQHGRSEYITDSAYCIRPVNYFNPLTEFRSLHLSADAKRLSYFGDHSGYGTAVVAVDFTQQELDRLSKSTSKEKKPLIQKHLAAYLLLVLFGGKKKVSGVGDYRQRFLDMKAALAMLAYCGVQQSSAPEVYRGHKDSFRSKMRLFMGGYGVHGDTLEVHLQKIQREAYPEIAGASAASLPLREAHGPQSEFDNDFGL